MIYGSIAWLKCSSLRLCLIGHVINVFLIFNGVLLVGFWVWSPGLFGDIALSSCHERYSKAAISSNCGRRTYGVVYRGWTTPTNFPCEVYAAGVEPLQDCPRLEARCLYSEPRNVTRSLKDGSAIVYQFSVLVHNNLVVQGCCGATTGLDPLRLMLRLLISAIPASQGWLMRHVVHPGGS